MSGGSFNYVSSKSVEELITSYDDDVRDMIRELIIHGAKDVADASEALRQDLRRTSESLADRLNALQPIWHALEWWQSGDWGRDRFDEEVAEWRANQPPLNCALCHGTRIDPSQYGTHPCPWCQSRRSPSHDTEEDQMSPPDDTKRSPAEEIAKRFHETYELLAPSFAYKTREASAVPWDEVPDQNRHLMIAVVGNLLADGTIK